MNSSLVVTADFLSNEECDSLISAWDEEGKEKGVTEDGADIRSGDICWLEFSDHADIVDRMVEIVAAANTEYFNMDLVGCRDRLQLSRYKEGDYYDWHTDAGEGDTQSRSLSFAVQLSRPDDYQGGDTVAGDPPQITARKRGSITIFPSDMRHQVTKVTQGERYSLVGWICNQ